MKNSFEVSLDIDWDNAQKVYFLSILTRILVNVDIADAQSVLLVKPVNTTSADFEFGTVILYHHTVLESIINGFLFHRICRSFFNYINHIVRKKGEAHN